MKLQSRLLLLKYAAKSRILSWSPRTYWGARKILRVHGEPELTLVPVLCRKDAASVDVGAHFGMYAFAMLEHSDSVHAFEPVPRLAKLLAQGYRGNARMTVHRRALSDSVGSATLRAPSAGLGRSTIESKNLLHGLKDPTGPVVSTNVEAGTLDQLGLNAVALIKIDVEGHEESVLRGGLKTLERCRPALIVELEERHNPGCLDRVSALLSPFGYERFQFDGRRLVTRVAPPRHNFLFLQPQHVEAVSRM